MYNEGRGLTIEKLTYLSDNGLFIVFEDTPPFLISYIDTSGVSSIEAEDMSIGGGYSTSALSYERRTIPIEMAIADNSEKSFNQLKIKLFNTIDLKYQGELTYQRDGEAYSIRGRFQEIPTGFDRVGSNEKFKLSFVATEQAKWKEKQERVSRIGAVEGGLTFPFEINPTIEFGTYTSSVALINDTYDNLPVKIIVIGTTESVTVSNETTGKFMQFNRAISSEQQLEIDTEKGSAYIKSAITGQFIENASHYLTLDSDYWHLQRGRNIISLDGGGQTNRPLGYLFWRKQFSGI